MKKKRLLISFIYIPFLASCTGFWPKPVGPIKYKLSFFGRNCCMKDENDKKITSIEIEAGQWANFRIEAVDSAQPYEIPTNDYINLKYTITGYDYDNDKYHYNDITGNISVKMSADITINAYGVESEPGLWSTHNDWWNYCSCNDRNERATKADIGQEVTLKVNNQDHLIRLIDVDHDDLANETGKAHCTFEFENLLSDENGYSLATIWNWKDGSSSTNYNFLDSNLRKALDGEGNGGLYWYRKGQVSSEQTQETSYADKTVLDMLKESGIPDNSLKKVIKPIAVYGANNTEYIVNKTDYKTQVFALSHKEMTKDASTYAIDEGLTYAFYKKDDVSRIKKQVNTVDPATTTTSINDGPCSAANYAGLIQPGGNYGGSMWLRSPEASGSYNYYGWYVSFNGGLNHFDSVHFNALAVAPAFCI